MIEETQPPIYFYLPSYQQFQQDFPTSLESSWEWMFERGKPNYALSDGEYAWTLQTFLQLQYRSFPCQIVSKMPEEGIVLTHRINLPLEFKPGPKLLFICLQADKTPHPFAQLSVVPTLQQQYTQYSFLGVFKQKTGKIFVTLMWFLLFVVFKALMILLGNQRRNFTTHGMQEFRLF
jgi:hypothetical protein